MTLTEARSMSEQQRRLYWIRGMSKLELDGYEAEARRRGFQPYEITAIAERRKALSQVKVR
ncbi:MAG: hypothetical protein ACK5QX_08520 [bacterium]|jgi:hypothetical protein